MKRGFGREWSSLYNGVRFFYLAFKTHVVDTQKNRLLRWLFWVSTTIYKTETFCPPGVLDWLSWCYFHWFLGSSIYLSAYSILNYITVTPMIPFLCRSYNTYLNQCKGKWASAWDFQQYGMCHQQSLRSACTYVQSDQSLCLSLEYSMIVKLLTERHLEFLSLKVGCTGSSESTLVKMQIVGNHVHWLKYQFPVLTLIIWR